jgi:hypothetical protein
MSFHDNPFFPLFRTGIGSLFHCQSHEQTRTGRNALPARFRILRRAERAFQNLCQDIENTGGTVPGELI